MRLDLDKLVPGDDSDRPAVPGNQKAGRSCHARPFRFGQIARVLERVVEVPSGLYLETGAERPAILRIGSGLSIRVRFGEALCRLVIQVWRVRVTDQPLTCPAAPARLGSGSLYPWSRVSGTDEPRVNQVKVRQIG